MNEHNSMENYPPDEEEGRSLWQDAWRRLLDNKLAMLGLCLLSLLIVVVLITPWVAHYAYDAQDLDLGAIPPNSRHWFGTDTLGRDLLTRILYGGRISLTVGFVATAVSLLIGVIYGTISGYLGGKVDAVLMRFVDILYALPFTLFVIMLMVVFGRHLWLIFVAIGAVEWLTMARIIRSQVMSVRRQDFVDAAVALGLSRSRIIGKHIIPNVLGPIIVYATLTIPQVMLFEAFLSFLGLGVQPPMSSWGLLIATGVETMEEYPWLLVFPGSVLATTLFALNFFGDGLRDALDPKSGR